ncbi:hypothetical protein NDU88_011815 [Pleurodeles waltl]|uniref:Uncharacterized protein n=1 Tax=Pleurodeles waltl TaxID=8319 RepID=A0AAV7QYF0_PLEWA|nr:hypothetical protein NDU88_011815 [Pleurodeles waltl]
MITSATAVLGSGRPYGLPLRVGFSEVPGRGQYEGCRPLYSPPGLCPRESPSRWSSRLSFSGAHRSSCGRQFEVRRPALIFFSNRL